MKKLFLPIFWCCHRGLPDRAEVCCAAKSRCTSATVAAAPAQVTADPFWPADGVFPVPGTRLLGRVLGRRMWNAGRFSPKARRKIRTRSYLSATQLPRAGTPSKRTTLSWHPSCESRHWRRYDPNLIYRLQDDVLSLHRARSSFDRTNDLGEHTSPEQIANNLRQLHMRIRAVYPSIRLRGASLCLARVATPILFEFESSTRRSLRWFKVIR